MGSGRAGRLRIGFSASLALTVLPGLLRTFRERFPAVELDIREMTTAPQLAALQLAVLHEDAVDIGLLREPPPAGEAGSLGFRTVLTEPFVAVLPSDHPLAARRTVGVGALAEEPFVLLPRAAGPGLYDRITEVCGSVGFAPRIVQHAVEWQTVCALVGAGLGVSLAPHEHSADPAAGCRVPGGRAEHRPHAGGRRLAPGRPESAGGATAGGRRYRVTGPGTSGSSTLRDPSAQ